MSVTSFLVSNKIFVFFHNQNFLMFDVVVILCPTLFHEICDSCRRSPY